VGLDEELARQLKRGDQAALETLVRRYHAPIHAYLVRMGGEYHLAADLVQEVFIKVCRHIGYYRDGLPFRPWIYTIASNTYKDYLKKAYVQKDVVGLATVETLPTTVDTPETAFLKTAERERIGQALQRLREIYREVLVLRYYQELKLEEIALTLKIPVGTVKSRLSTALHTLKKLLSEEGPTKW
jgi:RNA polymerase sigma factor (sigma-70 family)